MQIVDAVKTSEGASASYIAYVVRYEGVESRRRYSDFLALRQTLVALHPCHIVPPLPPKNSLASYAVAGPNLARAREDHALIARRRRMLAVFLNRVLSHRVLASDRVFRRFIESNASWHEIFHLPPATLAPKNPLKAPAADPTDDSLRALFSSLPAPGSHAVLSTPDQRFIDSESFTNKFSAQMQGPMEKTNRRLMKRWSDAAHDWQELGGALNGLALNEDSQLQHLPQPLNYATTSSSGTLGGAIEKVGEAIDGMAIATNLMLQSWQQQYTEPLQEYTQFSAIIKDLLKYRHMKHAQFELTRDMLESKRAQLEELERSEQESQRLENALARVRLIGENGRVESSADASASSSQHQDQSAAPAGDADHIDTSLPVSQRLGSSAILPPGSSPEAPATTHLSASTVTAPSPRRSGGGSLLGALTHTLHGIVDSDPEATRRATITKTRERITQLDSAMHALVRDVRHAQTTIQADLDRFQRQKVVDIREMSSDYASFHREWAEKVRAAYLGACG